jgi:hypothetical protein
VTAPISPTTSPATSVAMKTDVPAPEVGLALARLAARRAAELITLAGG